MGDFDFVMIICTPNEVTAANAGWRSQFRFRGSRHRPGVAEFVEPTFYEASKAGRRCRKVGKKMRQHYKGIGSKVSITTW